ncbi:6-pyruvoyl-tetrahydropterin synthase-related protein [Enterococcus sp. AZ163]|uniref:6-pyruvoyl-tetrahydropterin synthase-related protein n=1 Tax=Enterococcus sp. AZ163 TaxID=2774638 RepID=UPI003D2C1ABD
MLKQLSKYNHLLILFILSIFFMMPMFLYSGIIHFSMQDTYFHLSRITGMSNVWTSPVNYASFHHNGSMINQFYPWLTIYPAYLFYKITGSMVWGYKIYCWFITLATLLISYYSMFKMKKSTNIALIFSAVYTFSAYRATDLFYRGSLGEAVAMTFFPMVLAGTYEIFIGNEKNWRLLTFGMTLIVYTHLLSVAMLAVLIAFFLIISFPFWTNKVKRLKALFKATGTTVLLSLAFIVPFLEQMTQLNLYTPKGVSLEGFDYRRLLGNLIFNRINGFSIGLFLLLAIFMTIVGWKKLKKPDIVIFIVGVLMFISTTRLLPWDKLSTTPLLTIQFVWRLNAIVTLLLAYSFSVSFDSKKAVVRINRQILLLPIIVILHIVSIFNLYNSDKVYNLVARNDDMRTVIQDSDITGIDNLLHNIDYANQRVVENMDVVANYKFVLNGKEIKPEFNLTDSEVTIVLKGIKDSSDLVTPLYRYIGQKVTVNDKETRTKLSSSGTTELHIPKGNSKIKISYRYTRWAVIGRTISVIALIVISVPKNLVQKLKKKGEPAKQ